MGGLKAPKGPRTLPSSVVVVVVVVVVVAVAPGPLLLPVRALGFWMEKDVKLGEKPER